MPNLVTACLDCAEKFNRMENEHGPPTARFQTFAPIAKPLQFVCLIQLRISVL